MEKTFNKIKTGLATLGIAIVSFFSRVFGNTATFGDPKLEEIGMGQSLYGVPYNPPMEQPIFINTIIKIAQRPLIAITFIVGIVNFLKIRRIKDKTQKKKKIIRSVITIAILILLIGSSIIKFGITNPLKYNKQAGGELGTNIIKWIFIGVILLIGILYLIRTRKIKDKRQRRKVIIKAIIIVTLIVTYLLLAR